ncbi:hypothetical protein LTR53_008509 [Teratosphaeriaceae sp. CCFEE 6253]|nr:hypothetical protein LTR53_008509 [Teratosphaeriaceae sp. CCFEE 6253]
MVVAGGVESEPDGIDMEEPVIEVGSESELDGVDIKEPVIEAGSESEPVGVDMDEPPIEVGGDAGPEEGAAVDVPVNIVSDDMEVLEPKSSVTVVEPVASGDPDGEDPGLIDVPGMLLDVVPGMLLDVVIALVNVPLSEVVDEEVSKSDESVLPADPPSVEATLCCDGSDVVLDSVLDVSYDHVDGVLYTGSRDVEAEYGGTNTTLFFPGVRVPLLAALLLANVHMPLL